MSEVPSREPLQSPDERPLSELTLAELYLRERKINAELIDIEAKMDQAVQLVERQIRGIDVSMSDQITAALRDHRIEDAEDALCSFLQKIEQKGENIEKIDALFKGYKELVSDLEIVAGLIAHKENIEREEEIVDWQSWREEIRKDIENEQE